MAPGERPPSCHLALASLWLLHCCVAATRAVKVSVGAASVQVPRGASALLPCSFHTTAPLNRLNIIWTVTPAADPSSPRQVLAYEQGEVVEGLSPYTGRVAFAFPPTQSATLALNATRSSDSGAYQCSVMNPPDHAMPNIGVVRLTILVPPSWPVCSSEGSGEEGGSILLSCAVEEAVPTPIFTWEKEPPVTQPLVTSYAGDGRALLSLHNLTAAASGLYRCTAANTLATRSCALELHVHAGPRDTLGTAVGVGLTLAMGLVLLALLALGLWLHHQSVRERTEDEDEASYNEIRIDSLSPGRCIASRGPWDSSSSPFRASRVAKPLWFFGSSTPCTADTHLRGGGSSQLDREGSWSGSEGGPEDKLQAWHPASRTASQLPHLASLGAAAHPTSLSTGHPLLQPPLGL